MSARQSNRSLMRMLPVFTDRFPLVGPTFWILSIQYFLTTIIVARDWHPRYSFAQNTISDLGNTACGAYGSRQVCSPLHAWMNASFIVLGITMISGSILIYQEFRETRFSAIAFSFMALAGVGTILVGFFPENTVSFIHILGATLPFLFGNISLIMLGLALKMPNALRAMAVIFGVFSLTAALLFLTQHYLGIGIGGMERLTAYPQTIWLIVFGIYMSKNRFSSKR